MVVEVDEDVHIAVLAFLATGIRAEEPSPLHGLGGEIIANRL
jgi:hypothetical protein